MAFNPIGQRIHNTLVRAERQARQGRVGEAIRAYTEVLRAEEALPAQRAKAVYNRGVWREAIGDETGALADWSMALASADAPAWIWSLSWRQRGALRALWLDHLGAIADLSAAMVHSALLATNQTARADAKAYVAWSPRMVMLGAQALRGESRAWIGDTEGALADVLDVQEHPYLRQRLRDEAQRQLAVVLLLIGRPSDAQAALGRLPELRPEAFLRGLIALACGSMDAGMTYVMDAVAKLDRVSSVASAEAATRVVLERVGDFGGARPLLKLLANKEEDLRAHPPDTTTLLERRMTLQR